MARFQSFLLIVSVVLVLVLVSVQGCDYGACRSDAIDNEDDFVRWVTSDEWAGEWNSGVMSMLYMTHNSVFIMNIKISYWLYIM
jgi:hypothetical protein